MNLRPISLACGNAALPVDVRQQPHPLGALKPDCYITTIQVGVYPNEIQLVWETATPGAGLELARTFGNAVFNGVATAANEVSS
jgi:hypothetical protein